MDAYLAVVSRREVREYAARPLEPETEHRILEAGRLAGSAKNRQPWTFLVVRDDAAVEAVAESVFEPSNIRGAAFVVAVHMAGGAGIDAGRAVQNMLLAAHALGHRLLPQRHQRPRRAQPRAAPRRRRQGRRRAVVRPPGQAPRPRPAQRRRSGSSGRTASPTTRSSRYAREHPAGRPVRRCRQDREQRAELDLGLGQLGRRVGVAHDADARVEARLAPAQQRAAQRDAELAVLVGVRPADRAGVPAAVEALERGDLRRGDRVRLAADGRASGAAARPARSRCADG